MKQCKTCKIEIKKNKTYCSSKCACKDPEFLEKRKQANIDKFGVDNASKLNSIKEKISVANKTLDKENVHEKRLKTNKEKYGENCYELFREKAKETMLEKFGVDNYGKTEESKEINKKYNEERKKDPNYKQQLLLQKIDVFRTNYRKGLFQIENAKVLFTEDDYNLTITERKYLCLQCNKEFYRYSENIKRCTHCYPINKSLVESELYNFLFNFNQNIITTDRQTIRPFEIDILIPLYKIGIEYNGLTYHSYGKSSQWSKLDNYEVENKNYHLNKTKLCEEQNIQLLHIFENEWLNPTKQNIWKSIIKSKLNLNETIGARKCEIKEISSSVSKSFLDQNHLQGSINSSIRIGLFYQDELVSLLTFSKSRFNKNYDWEITRYCNKLNTNVMGGFSKLLKYFRKNYEGSIITYADKRYSDGNLYRQNGFIELKDSLPNYFYFKARNTKTLFSRVQFQKHKLKDKLEIFDETLTESENMFNNGYRRIWDCGNKVFIFNKSTLHSLE
jgi:hypothetical protein